MRSLVCDPGPLFLRDPVTREEMFQYTIDNSSVIGPKPATGADKEKHSVAYRAFVAQEAKARDERLAVMRHASDANLKAMSPDLADLAGVPAGGISRAPPEYWNNVPAPATPEAPDDWECLRGRAPEATGALSSEAFVRELREGWGPVNSAQSPTAISTIILASCDGSRGRFGCLSIPGI
jgi:hypothetical protein